MIILDQVSRAQLLQLVLTAMEFAREEGLLPQPPHQSEREIAEGLTDKIGHIETEKRLIPHVVAYGVREELLEGHAKAEQRLERQTEQVFQNVLVGVSGPARRALLTALASLDPREQRDVQQALMRKFDDLKREGQRNAMRRGGLGFMQ